MKYKTAPAMTIAPTTAPIKMGMRTLLAPEDDRIVMDSETEWDRDPLSPVTLIVYVPSVADEDTVTSRVEVAVSPADRVTLLGVRVAAIPSVGLIDRFTVPAKLSRLRSVIVEVPDDPRRTTFVAGFADMLKSGATTPVGTSRALNEEPLVPVTPTT